MSEQIIDERKLKLYQYLYDTKQMSLERIPETYRYKIIVVPEQIQQ